ncbi:MAG: hypothetical protein R3D03_21180 [Geminicoccaceae bacterium]|nr:hypothetical protein [Geminicoccaceae bacterium]
MPNRNPTRKLIWACVMAMIMAPPIDGMGKEYNQRKHVDPAQGAKIQRAIARSWMMQSEQGGRKGGRQDDITNTGCGGLRIGNIDQGAKSPRDQVIVIQGDIINAPRNCR